MVNVPVHAIFKTLLIVLSAAIAGCSDNAKTTSGSGDGVNPLVWRVSAPGTFDFTVPENVKQLHVTLFGASGGSYIKGNTHRRGGSGGKASAILSVRAGETLVVVIGGRGGHGNNGNHATGGFNGGGYSRCDRRDPKLPPCPGAAGGGGGATDIRRGGDKPRHRIVVAGGGGGAGLYQDGDNGGGPVESGLVNGQPCVHLRNIPGDGKDRSKREGQGSRGFNTLAGPSGGGGGGLAGGGTRENGHSGCGGTGKAGIGGINQVGGGDGHGAAIISWQQQPAEPNASPAVSVSQ